MHILGCICSNVQQLIQLLSTSQLQLLKMQLCQLHRNHLLAGFCLTSHMPGAIQKGTLLGCCFSFSHACSWSSSGRGCGACKENPFKRECRGKAQNEKSGQDIKLQLKGAKYHKA